MTIHILARVDWVHHPNSPLPPQLTRCTGNPKEVDKQQVTVWQSSIGRWARIPTCETCILLHWLNPTDTECAGDYFIYSDLFVQLEYK